MPRVSVSPGRDSRTRTRSRTPSRSLSTVVWTKRVSSTALARSNWGDETPFSSFSQDGGAGRSCRAGVAATGVTATSGSTTVSANRTIPRGVRIVPPYEQQGGKRCHSTANHDVCLFRANWSSTALANPPVPGRFATWPRRPPPPGPCQPPPTPARLLRNLAGSVDPCWGAEPPKPPTVRSVPDPAELAWVVVPGPARWAWVVPGFARLAGRWFLAQPVGLSGRSWPSEVGVGVPGFARLASFVGAQRGSLGVVPDSAKLACVRAFRPCLSEAQFSGYQHALDLAGALAYLQDLGVAVEAADRELVHEAVAAEGLGCVTGVVHGRVGGDQFRDRGLSLERLAAQHLRGGRVVGEAGGVRAGLHVRDLELDRLGVADRVPAGLPLVRVPHTLVHATLCQPDGDGRDRDPALVQDGQELGVAPATLAEQVLHRDSTVRKGQFMCVRAVPADLGVALRHREAGRAARHDDRGDLLVPVVGTAGDGGRGGKAGDPRAGVGDERLGAVDDPLAVPLDGGGQRRAGVRAATRLGEPEGAEQLAGTQPRQPLPLLLLGTEPVDRHGAEGDAGLDGDRDGRVDARQFLQRHTHGEEVAAHAAVLLRARQAEPSHPAHLRHDLVGELGLLVEVADDRRDLLAGELLHGLPQRVVLFGEPEVDHDCSSCGITTARGWLSATC